MDGGSEIGNKEGRREGQRERWTEEGWGVRNNLGGSEVEWVAWGGEGRWEGGRECGRGSMGRGGKAGRKEGVWEG